MLKLCVCVCFILGNSNVVKADSFIGNKMATIDRCEIACVIFIEWAYKMRFYCKTENSLKAWNVIMIAKS